MKSFVDFVDQLSGKEGGGGARLRSRVTKEGTWLVPLMLGRRNSSNVINKGESFSSSKEMVGYGGLSDGWVAPLKRVVSALVSENLSLISTSAGVAFPGQRFTVEENISRRKKKRKRNGTGKEHFPAIVPEIELFEPLPFDKFSRVLLRAK